MILPHAGISVGDRMAGLPSWAPDWANESVQTRLPLRPFANDEVEARRGGAPPPLSAFRYDEAANLLLARAARKDRIRVLAEPLPPDMIDFSAIKAWRDRDRLTPGLNGLRRGVEAVTGMFGATEAEEEAIWRCLVANRMKGQEVPGAAYRACFRAWLEMGNEGSGDFGDDNVDQILLRVLGIAEGIVEAMDGEAQRTVALLAEVIEFMSRVVEVSVGRSACVTENGRIGWAPERAAVGDEVVVFAAGGKGVYVVREMGNGVRKVQLVGECYVYGVSDAGEEAGGVWSEVEIV